GLEARWVRVPLTERRRDLPHRTGSARDPRPRAGLVLVGADGDDVRLAALVVEEHEAAEVHELGVGSAAARPADGLRAVADGSDVPARERQVARLHGVRVDLARERVP